MYFFSLLTLHHCRCRFSCRWSSSGLYTMQWHETSLSKREYWEEEKKHDSWTNNQVVTLWLNMNGSKMFAMEKFHFRISFKIKTFHFNSPPQVVMTEPYCMYEIVGITSFGKFCGFASSYGVYTDVASFVDFIERIVWP